VVVRKPVPRCVWNHALVSRRVTASAWYEYITRFRLLRDVCVHVCVRIYSTTTGFVSTYGCTGVSGPDQTYPVESLLLIDCSIIHIHSHTRTYRSVPIHTCDTTAYCHLLQLVVVGLPLGYWVSVPHVEANAGLDFLEVVVNIFSDGVGGRRLSHHGQCQDPLFGGNPGNLEPVTGSVSRRLGVASDLLSGGMTCFLYQ
jgi:hypothetical protein